MEEEEKEWAQEFLCLPVNSHSLRSNQSLGKTGKIVEFLFPDRRFLKTSSIIHFLALSAGLSLLGVCFGLVRRHGDCDGIPTRTTGSFQKFSPILDLFFASACVLSVELVEASRLPFEFHFLLSF